MGENNSIKEAVSLHLMESEKFIETVRFLALIKAVLLDRENSDEVAELNNLLKTHQELINPKIKKDRKDFAEKTEKSMDELFDQFNEFTKRMSDGRGTD